MELDTRVVLAAYAQQFNDLAAAYWIHTNGPKVNDLDTVAGEALDDLFRTCTNMVAHGETTASHLWLAVCADRGRMGACNTLAQFARALTIPPPTVVRLATPGRGAASHLCGVRQCKVGDNNKPSFPQPPGGPGRPPGGTIEERP